MQLGAFPGPLGTKFVVHAVGKERVAVRLDGADFPLTRGDNDMWSATVASASEGSLYKLVIDGDEIPDPYARFLPKGVHGPARVTAPRREAALAAPPHDWAIYELHVGTFTPEGTYRSAIGRLDHLLALGVTAIELMPVAAFDGARGWGYDGVALYAPYAPYGEPDDLRAFVRAAHQRGLAVILDVVYNHFGPAGNYLAKLSSQYFTRAVETPWGEAPNFDYAPMRELVLGNVRYWFTEFGFDALRLDAVHTIADESILKDVCTVAKELGRKIFLEEENGDRELVKRVGADGVWADALHHWIHVLLTGEQEGYYAKYAPSLASLAQCIEASSADQIVCLQNHDQVGNRALGTRLHHDTDLERFCAGAVLVLFLPASPLLFMGQEWATSAPFLYFSDHHGELGENVSKGRRAEFPHFESKADIPDPQAASTFVRSKIDWTERERSPHGRVLALHTAMLRLRREDPVLSSSSKVSARYRDDGVLEVCRRALDGEERWLFVSFSNEARPIDARGQVMLTSGVFIDGMVGPFSAVLVGRSATH